MALDPDYDDWFASLPLPDGAKFIRLPRPISANNLFANVKGKGRVRSADYNTWRWHVLAMLQKQKPLPTFAVPVNVTFYVGEKGVSPAFDAGNAEKAYTDALVEHGVIPDDKRKWVRSIAVAWVPGEEGCIAMIAPTDDMQIGKGLFR